MDNVSRNFTIGNDADDYMEKIAEMMENDSNIGVQVMQFHLPYINESDNLNNRICN